MTDSFRAGLNPIDDESGEGSAEAAAGGESESTLCTDPVAAIGSVTQLLRFEPPEHLGGDFNQDEHCRTPPVRPLGRLRELLADVVADGWNSSSGLEVLRLIRRECVAESSRWVNRAGSLGEIGVAPVWVALAEWMSGERRADPIGVLRVTARRVYAAEAAGVELGLGDPVNRPRPLVRAATDGRGPRRTDVDLAMCLASDMDEDESEPFEPAWLLVTAQMLMSTGWAWPQSPTNCLAAVAAELPATGRRAAPAMARQETGVPGATWSALALLAGGSGPGCATERAWPGVPSIHDLGGAEAVRRSAEVRRIVLAAVAGRAVRSGRAWLVEARSAS